MEFTKAIQLSVFLCIVYCSDIAESSGCQWDMNKNQAIYQIGDTLVLSCTYTGQQANFTNAAILDPHGKRLQLYHVTGNRSFVATNQITSCYQGGTYVCMPDHCGRTLRNAHTIRVEDSSTKPNISCVFNTFYGALSNLTCKWRPNCENNYYRWELWYKNETVSSYQKCKPVLNRSCVIPAKYTIPYETYQLKLIQMEHLQPNRTYEYTIYTDQSVWKLEVIINNITSTTPDSINLPLHVSERVRTMVCVVQYTSEWESASKQINYTVPHTPDLNVAIPLDGLEPFTLYDISVQCKPTQSHYWSNTVHTLYRTLPSAPNGIPSRMMFADEMKTSGRRKISFYWTPLSKRQLRGNQTEYTITYLTDTRQNVTDVFPADSVTAILKTIVQSDGEISLQIGSRNEAGIGSMNKLITVSRHKQASFQTVIIRGRDNSNITVFWDGNSRPHEHRSFNFGRRALTFHWCKGSSLDGNLVICNSPIVSEISSEETITINTSNHGNAKWYFGASIPTDGTFLPNIIWSECYFTDILRDDAKKMEVSLARHNFSTIAVKLGTGYCEFDNMPSVYQVAIYPTETKCSVGRGFTNYTAVPSLKTLYVPSNEHEYVYLCFRVVFKNGQTSNSGPFVLDLTNQEADSIGPFAAIIGVSVAGVMTLVIVLVIWFRRYRLRLQSMSKIEDITVIPYPSTDRSNLEGRYTLTTHVNSGPHLYDSAYQDSLVILRNDLTNIEKIKTSVTTNDSADINNRHSILRNDVDDNQESNTPVPVITNEVTDIGSEQVIVTDQLRLEYANVHGPDGHILFNANTQEQNLHASLENGTRLRWIGTEHVFQCGNGIEDSIGNATANNNIASRSSGSSTDCTGSVLNSYIQSEIQSSTISTTSTSENSQSISTYVLSTSLGTSTNEESGSRVNSNDSAINSYVQIRTHSSSISTVSDSANSSSISPYVLSTTEHI